VMGYHAASVLVAERIGPLVYQGADLGFVGGFAVSRIHRASPAKGFVMHNPRTNGAGVVRQKAIIFFCIS